MSSPKMFLKIGGKLLETEDANKKGPESNKKLVRLYLKVQQELVPFLDSK